MARTYLVQATYAKATYAKLTGQVNTWTEDVSFTRNPCLNQELWGPKPIPKWSSPSSLNPTRPLKIPPRNRYLLVQSRTSLMPSSILFRCVRRPLRGTKADAPFSGPEKPLMPYMSILLRQSTCTSLNPILSKQPSNHPVNTTIN